MRRHALLCPLRNAALFTLLSIALFPGSSLRAQTPAPSSASSGATAQDGAGKQQFFMRLIPPRPTFPADMTESEKALMQQHAAYWAALFKTGDVLIIGPVDDPKGAFGMAVLECTLAEAQTMANGDPTVKAGLNKIEVIPMHVFMRKQ